MSSRSSIDSVEIALIIFRHPELYLQVVNSNETERNAPSHRASITRGSDGARHPCHPRSRDGARPGHMSNLTRALGYIVLAIPKPSKESGEVGSVAAAEARVARAPTKTTCREQSAPSTATSRQSQPCSHRPSMSGQPQRSSSSSQSPRKVSFADAAKPTTMSSSPNSQPKLASSSRSQSPDSATIGMMQLQMRYTKETEGRRMKSERLRQRTALQFAERSMRWMAISQPVTLGFVAVVAIVVLKA